MAPHPPPAYHIQDNRLASFSGITKPKSLAKPAFPLSSSTHPHLTPESLAKAGFYHHPSEQEGYDTCKCFLCGVELGGWDPDDDPFEEHARRGGCAWGEIVCQVNADRKNGKLKTVFGTPESMPSSKQTTSVREQTFKQWWPHKKKGWLPTVKNLARAGFVYTPESGEDDDTVTCPYCQKSLNGWEATDDPMKIHFDKAPQCYFFVAELSTENSSKATGASTKSTGRRGHRATTAAPSEAAPTEVDVESAVEPAEQTALRQSTRKPPKPRATTTTKAKGGRGRKKAATEDLPEEEEQDGVLVPETQAEHLNAEDDVIEVESQADPAGLVDKAEDVIEEGVKEKPKSKARKPRATTRGRNKKTDEEEKEPNEEEQGVAVVEAQPPVQPSVQAPVSKSSKPSKPSKPSKSTQSKASDKPAQSSDKPSKSSGRPSKPSEKPLPPLPPPSLPTSPQPQPLSQLERFANIPPTSPAVPTPRPKSTLVSSRLAIQPSPRADLPREVLDKSVHQGALEARSVMDDLVKSPVLARIMGGQTDEEDIEIPLTEEQKGMTLEELVRSEMKKRYDALQREGGDMISQWEDRAKEARKRIETV